MYIKKNFLGFYSPSLGGNRYCAFTSDRLVSASKNCAVWDSAKQLTNKPKKSGGKITWCWLWWFSSKFSLNQRIWFKIVSFTSANMRDCLTIPARCLNFTHCTLLHCWFTYNKVKRVVANSLYCTGVVVHFVLISSELMKFTVKTMEFYLSIWGVLKEKILI